MNFWGRKYGRILPRNWAVHFWTHHGQEGHMEGLLNHSHQRRFSLSGLNRIPLVPRVALWGQDSKYVWQISEGIAPIPCSCVFQPTRGQSRWSMTMRSSLLLLACWTDWQARICPSCMPRGISVIWLPVYCVADKATGNHGLNTRPKFFSVSSHPSLRNAFEGLE